MSKSLHASNSPQKNDDEIDLVEIAQILISKWPALLIFTLCGGLLGLFVASYLRPVFSSNALLQVEQSGKGAGVAFGDMGALLEVASPADAEIQLIGSRYVLDEVVLKEHLSISATPVALLPRLLRKEGRVDLEELHIPAVFDEDAKWFLIADENLPDSAYQVLDPRGKTIVEGKVGETYRVPVMTDTFSICVLHMMASPAEKFRLSEVDPRNAVDALQKRLSVAEQGKKTGIISMQITDRFADRAAQILNTVADTYVRQNVEARSEEATKTLQFLEKQLPDVKAKLDSAEQVLSLYRKNEGSIDLTGEARTALEKRMELEKRLLELAQKEQEMARLFKEDHPSLVALKKQTAQVHREMARLGEETKDLPYKQQEILRLQGDVQVNNSIYTNMLNNIQQLRIVQAGEVGNVRIVDRARVELRPVKPRRSIILLGSVVGGFAFGAAAVLVFRIFFGRGLRSSREIENETGIGVYAKVPESNFAKDCKNFSVVEQNDDDVAVEALRTVRTSLEFSMAESAKVLLVSGLVPHSGKSFVAKNLSALFAKNGKKVLLIGTDFRASRLSSRGRKCGLSDYLLGRISLEEAIEHLDGSGIDLLAEGSFVPSPSELIASKAFENLVREMALRYDLVLLDSAPILVVNDAQIACRYADFVLLVLRYAKDSMEGLEEAVSLLDKSNAKNRACVLNRCERSRGLGYGYGYGYGGHYGSYGKTSKS